MKRKGLIGFAAILLFTSGLIQAGDEQSKSIVNQNLSKRPYQEVPAAAANPGEEFEGATLIKDAEAEKAESTKYQQLRIRMLGRQPYMEK